MSNNTIFVVCPACAKICKKGRSLSSHLDKEGTDCAEFLIKEKIPEAHYTIGHPDQCFFPPPLVPAESLIGNLNSTSDNDTEEHFPYLPDDSSQDSCITPDSGISNSNSNSHDKVC